MLSERTLNALDGMRKASKQGYKVRKLHKVMCSNLDLWTEAYANIYSNQGAMTKGIDSNTLDGMNEDRFLNLINQIRNRAYCPKPCRRTYIPKDPRKPNGNKRPLGIPNGDDKLTQEVMKMILEKIYEPIFSPWSYGFRKGKSCHTALKEIRDGWKSTKWVCNVDIKGYFDNIDHNLLMKFLSNKIKDTDFLSLLKKFLKAGYMEDWRYFGTHSGTPQGGIISPLLANIYLHELDMFMKVKIREFNKGNRRQPNPEYKRVLQNRANRIKWVKQGYGASGALADSATIERWKLEITQLEEQLKDKHSVLTNDPNFRRMRYVRYADDFLIGIIGSKSDAVQVMKNVTQFVEAELNLEVSKEKSGIVDPKQGFNFLGYEVKTRKENKRVKCIVAYDSDGSKTHAVKRTITGHVHLGVPRTKIQKFCGQHGYGNYDVHRDGSRSKPQMTFMSDYEIISQYNAEMRGFANYYHLTPVLYLNKLHWIWMNSLFKTLAHKHRTSRAKVAKRLRQPDGRYVYREIRNNNIYEIELFKLKNRCVPSDVYVDPIPNTFKFSSRTELLDRMTANKCEYCGTRTGYLEVHHIRKLKDIRKGTSPWMKLMISRQRKTLILCKDCHIDLHRGTLPDIRAFRKSNGEPYA